MTVVISSELVVSDVNLSPGGVTIGPNNGVLGWRNVVTASNTEADFEDTSFPVINVANPSTYFYWLSTSLSFQRVITTVNFSEMVDYVGIAGHNFGTGGVAVKIEVATLIDSSGDYDWEDVTDFMIPPDDSPLLFRFTPGSFLAVSITLMPSTVVPRMAVVYIGLLTRMERRIYVGHRIIKFNTVANIVTGRSEFGQFLGRLNLGQTTTSQIEFKNMTPQFYREELEPFRQAAIEIPFFFAWRPQAYPLEVGYCWSTADMEVPNSLANGFMAASLNVQGIVA